jgi:hypothetical protein
MSPESELTMRLAVAVLTAAALSPCSASEIPAPPGRHAALAPVTVSREPAHRYVHACTGDIRPDRAVIVGGMTAEAVKPTEAQAQLDRQIAELKRLAASHGGEVRLLERLRAARAASDRQPPRAEPPPFVALQRLEVDLPATVDVDALLERVLRLGLDRFGSGVRIEYVDTNPRVLVRYRFSALARELDALHERCRQQAIGAWCAGSPPVPQACSLAPEERGRRFRTQSLSVQTQPLLLEQGGVTRYRLSLPWPPDQVTSVEVLGNLAVRFEGTLHLAVSDEPQ